eukprot:GGOE01013963.1.p1 GENE.GGOE01013963.1~~GGOE01013963.1.p1  ORF type:complete len:311 (+),score=91.18 GGOE01013963.1:23-934(+)
MDSVEEQTRYDRQIRLWGHEAQRRMRASRVLVVHLSGLAVEVVKNLVLAGIGAVHVLDGQVAQPTDLAVNFFLEASDLGQNRATAACERIRSLNPLVEVTCEAGDASSKPDDFWAAFDVVCLTECPLSLQERVEVTVRQAGKAFLACNSFGLLSMVFLDFGPKFGFTMKTDAGNTEKDVAFATLQQLYACNQWHSYRPSRIFLACQVLLHAADLPTFDLPCLISLRDQLAATHGFGVSDLPDEYLESLLTRGRGELSPVCTVVGGVVAQEILKVPQRTAEPLVNVFLYDALESDLKGIVERIP